MTLEQNIADLTTATTELTQQVLQTKSDADAAKVSAQGSAAAAAAAEQTASVQRAAASAAQTAAEAARDAAQTSADNAAAVVTGGTATLASEAGKIPLADAEGKIDSAWIDKDYFGIDYTPSVQPTLSSDFAHNKHKRYEQYGLEPKTILQQWDVVRNSEATYFDANGVLQTAGIDEPRIDYDPVTGECRGLLAEGQGTRLNLYPTPFDNAYWVKTRCDITPNAATSPSGNIDADLLTSNDVNESYISCTGLTLASAGSVVLSVYLKPDTATFAHLMIWGGSLGGTRCWFDLASGVFTTQSSFGTPLYVLDAYTEPAPFGYVRAVVVVDATVTSIRARLACSSSSGEPLSDDGLSMYAWGAQVEQGSKPTSLILGDESAQVTRVADTITPTV